MTLARILVAEDNDQLRQLLATLLGGEGHDVTVARDGAEALQIAASTPRFDLLITDYVMPIVDGVDLAMALQADPTPAPPVIVYSAYPPDGKLLPLVELSQVHYVSKGQRVDKLLQRVEDLLKAS